MDTINCVALFHLIAAYKLAESCVTFAILLAAGISPSELFSPRLSSSVSLARPTAPNDLGLLPTAASRDSTCHTSPLLHP